MMFEIDTYDCITRGLKITFIQRVWKVIDLDLIIVDHSDSDRLLFTK